MRKIGITILCMCLATSAVLGILDAYQTAIEVKGKVEDRDGEPLKDIGIRAIRRGENIGETRSSGDGSYRLRVSEGRAFDLCFDDPDFHPTVMALLSGRESHRISVVMAREGETLDIRSRLASSFATDYLRSLRPKSLRDR